MLSENTCEPNVLDIGFPQESQLRQLSPSLSSLFPCVLCLNSLPPPICQDSIIWEAQWTGSLEWAGLKTRSFCGWEWMAGKKSRIFIFGCCYVLILTQAKPSIFTLVCISKCFTDEMEPGTLMAVLNLEACNAIFPSLFLFSTCCALTQCFGVRITV